MTYAPYHFSTFLATEADSNPAFVSFNYISEASPLCEKNAAEAL